jgi:hypothetical protein
MGGDIKTDFKETGCGVVDCDRMIQNRVRWRAFENTVKIFGFHKKRRAPSPAERLSACEGPSFMELDEEVRLSSSLLWLAF